MIIINSGKFTVFDWTEIKVKAGSGGDGAVREACEYVLRLNGYEGTMASLLGIEAGMEGEA